VTTSHSIFGDLSIIPPIDLSIIEDGLYYVHMFTPEEKKLLADYVTSTEENIFAVKNMPGMVGAAYARYSRAKGGFREVLLKEFLKEGVIDPKHADKLIERILIAYGDDSVGELEGAHVSFEQISMIATKELEDRRIGGSPIEQSTRYVFYDQKNNEGHWLYLRHASLTEAQYGEQYIRTMDRIFEIYAALVEPMRAYFEKKKTLEEAEYDIDGDGVKERYADLKEEKDLKAFRTTYQFDLRTKACDVLRALLPLSTLTNVGMFGNGRFYQGVISHLQTSDIPEAQQIAAQTLTATSELIPQYVRRARRSDYTVSVRQAMHALADEMLASVQSEPLTTDPEVGLLQPSGDRDVDMIASMLYPYARHSLRQLRAFVAGLSSEDKQRIIATYIGERKTRRDRPGRALEDGYPYTFDFVTNWGVYKDLMRHRMTSQQRQFFGVALGFGMPDELVDAGLDAQAREAIDLAEQLYAEIAKSSPLLAQYAVLHGHRVRWTLACNDRELMHLTELRSTPQGHPQYRQVAQLMHTALQQISPWRAEMMKFVDYADYYWTRGDAEAKQRVKERAWEQKYGASAEKDVD
jgi:thymidylate synthase ThyX